MYESENCYIRYPLLAVLIATDPKNDPQMYAKHLNILEPIRSPIGKIVKESFFSPQCCGCCKGYGIIKMGLSSDTNFVKSGDTIQVNCFVDNTAGT
jgi:hypothetical protein